MILADQINLRFKVTFPDGFDTAGAYMAFSTTDGRSITVQLSGAEKVSDSVYWFAISLNPLELADTVTATLHYGTDGVVTNEYSAVQYIAVAKDLYASNTSLVALLNALQNYGYYMQQSGWTDQRDHATIQVVTELGAGDLATAKAGVSDKGIVKELGSGIVDAKFSLTWSDKTVISVAVKPADGAEVSSGSYSNTQSIAGATYYRQDTQKIGPKLLGTTQTFTFETTGGNATVQASAMSYVHTWLNKDTTDQTRAKQYAMAAYYNYYVAADSYQE